MYSSTLAAHPHTGVPLTPVGYRKDGRPIWPVLGASEDDDAAADQGDDNPGDQDDANPGDGDDHEDAEDWKARFEAQQRINRSLERKTKRDLARLKELEQKAQVKDVEQPDLEQIRAEAAREVQSRANARILRSEIKAAAGGKLADPNDAVRLLDLDEFEVDDNGNVDEQAIADAIAELVEKKPYLAAQGGKRFKGNADGGARKEHKTSIDDQIREAETKGDWKTSMALKAQKSLAAQGATA